MCYESGYAQLCIAMHSKQLGTREYRSMDKGQSCKMQLMLAIEDAMVVARSRERFMLKAISIVDCLPSRE